MPKPARNAINGFEPSARDMNRAQTFVEGDRGTDERREGRPIDST